MFSTFQCLFYIIKNGRTKKLYLFRFRRVNCLNVIVFGVVIFMVYADFIIRPFSVINKKFITLFIIKILPFLVINNNCPNDIKKQIINIYYVTFLLFFMQKCIGKNAIKIVKNYSSHFIVFFAVKKEYLKIQYFTV